jgi:tRNA nucleotidyltransferase (CCA-adding enzyme)
MSPAVPQVSAQSSVTEALNCLAACLETGLEQSLDTPLWVIDGSSQLVGKIGQRDLALALHYGCGAASVQAHMDEHVRAIAPDTPLSEAEFLLMTQAVAALPVVAQGQLVGMVSRTTVCAASVPSRPSNPMSHAFLLPLLQQRLVPELWQVLTVAALLAGQRGWQLYIVGGAVRDVLRLIMDGVGGSGSLLLEDIDLVVDGGDRPVDRGAGVELATALQSWYPTARLEIYRKFQTAALRWQNDPCLCALGLDLATARTEFYAYPAANPQVSPSSVEADLYRRDFTINAMAIRLTESGNQEQVGELLDFYGGVSDLQHQQVRVLHAHSFIEDPTRIYRAVRFAVRLGFQVESQTERWIRAAIASGIYAQVQHQHAIVPALQTRLKAELKYLFQTAYWQPALRKLADLGALRCVHPALTLDAELWRQLRLAERCHRRSDALPPIAALPLWELLLTLMIARLDPAECQEVAQNLQFGEERLAAIAPAEADILEQLVHCDRPSAVRRILQPYDLPLLVILAIRCPRGRVTPVGQPIRRLIGRYVTVWSNIKPLLNGRSLKKLGYESGPQFRQILAALTDATVDGQIRDRQEALAFLAQHFPRR